MKYIIALAVIIYGLLNPIRSQSISDSSVRATCEEDDCTKCFNKLVYETVKMNKNQYYLQLAFFPPDREAAIFVIVNYNFLDSNRIARTKTWFWSASTYHLYQPPSVLQYTSLFFTEPEARSSSLNLTLPMECANADNQMMQLLTQRVS